MFPDFTLTNQVAMVTGATGGIGHAASLTFAHAGADLALLDLEGTPLKNLVEKIKAMGRQAIGLAADVTKKEQVERAVEQVVKRFGRIDVLFNNAGIGARQPFVEVTEETWDRIIAVNLKGAFLVAQSVARKMVEKRKGVIVNTASIVSFVGRNNVSAYGASKAGVGIMTKIMAMELASYGIRVNSIAPGMIHTPFTATFLEADNGLRMKSIGSTIPLKRVGEPEDIVGAILFLASSASAYITGATILIDGGWTAGVETKDEGWTIS
ncbi:MAG: hypothetical protein A2W09_02895 [Deltaproteobacteria bacterium RBG_16_50_11]|nr:MAG: hypothetical protein A2W09_02895 [Deltaproteobacteria bacterium RBG_16_50_11]